DGLLRLNPRLPLPVGSCLPDRSPGDYLRRPAAPINLDALFQQLGPSPFRGVLGQHSLKGAAVHAQLARGLGNVAIALFVNPLDVLPAQAIDTHGMFRWRWQTAFLGHQGRLDLVGIRGLGQVDRKSTRLNSSHVKISY